MTSLRFEREIIKAIQKVVGPSSKKDPIALHEPSFHKTNAIKYLKDCIDTGWVSSAGGYVNKFESAICDFTQAKFCVCLVNGTVSIRLALDLLGVKPGDEVLLPLRMQYHTWELFLTLLILKIKILDLIPMLLRSV